MKARIKPPEFKSLGSARYSRILQILNSAKKGLPEDVKDFDVPIEYLIGGCYPELWETFQENIRIQFNAGYQQGLLDALSNDDDCAACQITNNEEDKNAITVNS